MLSMNFLRVPYGDDQRFFNVSTIDYFDLDVVDDEKEPYRLKVATWVDQSENRTETHRIDLSEEKLQLFLKWNGFYSEEDSCQKRKSNDIF